jgi:hypothetical protein
MQVEALECARASQALTNYPRDLSRFYEEGDYESGGFNVLGIF